MQSFTTPTTSSQPPASATSQALQTVIIGLANLVAPSSASLIDRLGRKASSDRQRHRGLRRCRRCLLTTPQSSLVWLLGAYITFFAISQNKSSGSTSLRSSPPASAQRPEPGFLFPLDHERSSPSSSRPRQTIRHPFRFFATMMVLQLRRPLLLPRDKGITLDNSNTAALPVMAEEAP